MKSLLGSLSRRIGADFPGFTPVPPGNSKQGSKSVCRDIPATDKAPRDEGLVVLVTYAEQETENYYNDCGNCKAGGRAERLQAIEKRPGKGAVGNEVQKLINANDLR